jgi:hypothetical protein
MDLLFRKKIPALSIKTPTYFTKQRMNFCVHYSKPIKPTTKQIKSIYNITLCPIILSDLHLGVLPEFIPSGTKIIISNFVRRVRLMNNCLINHYKKIKFSVKWLDRPGPGWEQSACFCICGNEPSCSIQYGVFLD